MLLKPYVFRLKVPVSEHYYALPRRYLSAVVPHNNELSGGLPHSEIRGSKPILGSPQLIAEYHVLHRLLLPRHPPNALLALDLIQKKTGLLYQAIPKGITHPIPTACAAKFWSKVIQNYSRTPRWFKVGGTLVYHHRSVQIIWQWLHSLATVRGIIVHTWNKITVSAHHLIKAGC